LTRIPEKFEYIPLRTALKNLLKEQGLTLNDVLDAMDETPERLRRSIIARINLSSKDLAKLEVNYTSRQLNLLIFAVHVFYLSGSGGVYKGKVVVPLREEVIGRDGRVTKEGLIKIIKSLGLKPRWAISGTL